MSVISRLPSQFVVAVVCICLVGFVQSNAAMAGVIGACCDEYGFCYEETQVDCEDFGGVYSGDGTECGVITCPLPASGACCDMFGCFEDLPEFCDGDFHGAGTFCGDYECEDPVPPFGACIDSMGVCVVTSQFGCENFEGNYQGDGTDCGGGNCTPGANGACCLPNQVCIETDATGCSSQGGLFQGGGNACFMVNCFSTLGACCVTGQPCIENTTDECAALGGVYQPDADCAGVDCASVGACCLMNESCIETTPADCQAQAGFFQGTGLPCASVSCTELGGCCFPDRACVGTSQQTCFNLLGGSSFTSGVDVCSTSCPEYGACCRADGQCELILGFLCDDPGDVFLGHGEPCPDCCDAGSVGACCFLDDTCQILTELVCTSLDGSFQGAGRLCSEVDCIDLGDCCFTDGMCIGSSVSDCFNLHGGDLWSDCGECEAPCSGNICPDFGACCMPDGTCISDWDFACTNNAGTFQGQGVDCATVTCEVAPCTMPGDTSGDATVNGVDVQAFVACIVGQAIGTPPTPDCECSDVDLDGAADINDVDAFVCELIGGVCP